MPDPTPTAPAEAAAPAAPVEPTTPTPAAGETTTTQGDPAELGDAGKKALDAERTARKAAEKAATELQAQIDKINQANETAVEKATREANEFKEVAAKATADALRFRVAAKHNISEDDADLFLTGTDETTLERQAARLSERNSSTTEAGPRPDLTQGGNPPASSGDPAQQFASIIRGHLGS